MNAIEMSGHQPLSHQGRSGSLATTNVADKRERALSRRRVEIDPKSRELGDRFAVHLRALLERRGWSSQHFAAMLAEAGVNVAYRAVDVWLRGGLPRARDLERIADVLGLDDYRQVLPDPLPLRKRKPRS